MVDDAYLLLLQVYFIIFQLLGLFQWCITAMWMSTNLSVGRLCLTFLHDIAAKAYKCSGVGGHWGFSFVYYFTEIEILCHCVTA